MNSRVLPVLNLVGCLALTGLIVTQWFKERTLDGSLANLKNELATARHQAAEDAKHRSALERDIAVLKETIESSQKAAEEGTRQLAGNQLKLEQLDVGMKAASEQLGAWEQAVGKRDERIRLLESELAEARKRLDEAVARLKAAGGR